MKNKSNSIESLIADGLVKRANEIENNNKKRNNWITEIENYCSIAGILPEDLIKCHKEAQGGIKKEELSKDRQMVKDAFKAAKNYHSKWNDQYKNRKLGL